MANVLKGFLSTLSIGSSKGSKILILDGSGTKNEEDVYDEMMKEITGLKRETIVHVVTLFLRVVSRLILNGHSINVGLFRAVARFTGVIEKGVWNPAKNSVYVSFTQDKLLREEIRKTKIDISSEKPDASYILEIEDRVLGITSGQITPGNNIFVRGSRLKIAGSNAANGINFTHSDGTTIKLESDNITINNPSELTLLLPSDMKNGDYEMTITTQFSGNSNVFLKEPRVLSANVTIGGGSGERPDDL